MHNYNMRHRELLLILIVNWSLLNIASAQQQPEGLGFLSESRDQNTSSTAHDFSENGEIIVGAARENEATCDEAFRWSKEDGMVRISSPAISCTGAPPAVSDDGKVIVGTGFNTNDQVEAFRWTVDEGLVGLGFLQGDHISREVDISADGSVIAGNSIDSDGGQGFRWTAATGMVALPHLSGGNSVVRALSSDGVFAVGGSTVGNGLVAVRWQGTGSPQNLGQLPGRLFTGASDVSDDGSVVVGVSSGNDFPSEAFRWTEAGGMQALGIPPGATSSSAFKVSGDGSVVLVQAGTLNYIWDEVQGLREFSAVLRQDYNVDLSEWSSIYPRAIAANNREIAYIVGGGINSSGRNEAWRLNLAGSPPIAWSNPAGGAFENDDNWVGGRAPDANQGALFDETIYAAPGKLSAEPVTITFDQVVSTEMLSVAEGQVILDFQAHSYGVDHLRVGGLVDTTTASRLTIVNGALGATVNNGVVTIGAQGTRGLITVGADGFLEVSPANPGLRPTLQVGANSCSAGECGLLAVEAGGTVFSQGALIGGIASQGRVTVAEGGQWTDTYRISAGDVSGTGIIDIDGGTFEARRLVLGMDQGGQGSLSVKNTSPRIDTLTVGQAGEGQVTIGEGASVLGDKLVIGDGGTGTVVATGIGLLFEEIVAGNTSEGSLELLEGARALTLFLDVGREMAGSVSVFDDSTLLLFDTGTIAASGTGAATIRDGGRLDGQRLRVGATQESNGQVNIYDPTSRLLLKRLEAGVNGAAGILISDAAVAGVDSLLIGVGATGNGDVQIEKKSKMLASDLVVIAQSGRGGASILSGGSMTTGNVVIGDADGSIGSLLVDGDSSIWVSLGSMRVGGDGIGIARLTEGGELRIHRTLFIGSFGSLDASGGILHAGGLRVASGGTFIDTTGVLNVGGAPAKQRGVATVDSLILAEGAVLDVREVVFGEGAYLGGGGAFPFVYTNSGGLNPGDAPGEAGEMTLAGYTQTEAGVLEIELGPEATDLLTVDGAAILSGTLRVTALEGFAGEVGQAIEIVRADRITETFAEIVMTNIGVAVGYTDSTVVLHVVSSVAIEEEAAIAPSVFVLDQNYPNPFNPRTVIGYALVEAGPVELVVYDLLGREVRRLVDGVHAAGRHEVIFAAEGLPSGTYLYRIQAGDFIASRRMILLR